MSPSRIVMTFLLPIFIYHLMMISPSLAQPTCSFNAEYCLDCSNIGDYSANSTYKGNLDKLLTSITSSPSNNQNFSGFYNTSLGQNPDKVNVIALCGGFLTDDKCWSCLNDSYYRLMENCTNKKEAIIWYEHCMLHYSSNDSIFSVMEDDPSEAFASLTDRSDAEQFNQKLKPLLDYLATRAASGNSLRKFAHGKKMVPNAAPIHALLQCTPDLSKKECSDCLQEAIHRLPQCCEGKEGGRVLKPSCNLRYESDPFYESNYTGYYNESVGQPTPSKEGNSKTRTIVVAVVVTTIIVATMLIGIFISLNLRKPGQEQRKTDSDEISWAESLHFDFGTLRAATDDFSEENKLGQGGFGAVYKGRLSNGQYVAVKRLSKTSGQGDQEFKNEVLLVAKLQHRNLVRLLGFCLEEKERLLVYEYVPNSSLDRFIFDPTKRAELQWDIRVKIVHGIVRGLLYLHEDSRLKIIHRDLKASNILLDEEMKPKISDFGIARLFVADQTQDNTSRIVGTYGYMAPEYAMHGQFSVKSDVYSFGVLLLEIVCGQKNSCFRVGEELKDLLTYAWGSWKAGTASDLIDPTISAGSTSEIMRFIHIGLLCVQENITERPTMNSVALMLNSLSHTLAVPSKPAFFMGTTVGPDMPLASNVSGSRRDYVQGSANEASISELNPR